MSPDFRRADEHECVLSTGVLQLKELANKNELFFRRQKDSAPVQLCKLQSLGKGSLQVQDSLLLIDILAVHCQPAGCSHPDLQMGARDD